MTRLLRQPERPFFSFNNRYIRIFRQHKNFKIRVREIFNDVVSDPRPNGQLRIHSTPNVRERISEKSLKKGDVTRDAVIIDINCRKFTVTGLETKGFERDIFNLFGMIGERQYYFEFLVGEPEQLTFEQARKEIVDHICSCRWVNQTGGSSAHFRQLHGSKETMAELMAGISFYGKWPF